jgi:ferredoxin
MTIFYFTGTGNSLAVAKRIGGNLISIPQIVDFDNLHYKDDIIGVVFPVYALTMPNIVIRFLEEVMFEADFIFAIGTYGLSAGATISNLQQRFRKNIFHFDYVDGVRMLDNCLPQFDMEEQAAKLPGKNVDQQIAQITKNIKSRKLNNVKVSVFNKAFSAFISNLLAYDKFKKSPLKYIISDQCNKCGVCVKVCPVKNITVTDKVHFNNSCESCQACVHQCPQNALHVKNERSNKRWRNPEVSLQEIITANNRLS